MSPCRIWLFIQLTRENINLPQLVLVHSLTWFYVEPLNPAVAKKTNKKNNTCLFAQKSTFCFDTHAEIQALDCPTWTQTQYHSNIKSKKKNNNIVETQQYTFVL